MPVKGEMMALLTRPAGLEEALRAAELETGRRLERCEHLVAHYGGGTAGRPLADARDEAAAAYSDALEEQRRLEEALRAAEAEVEAFLGEVRRGCAFRDYCLLRSRYLLRRTWPRVRRDMEETFGRTVAQRTVHYWHSAALGRAEAVWEGGDLPPPEGIDYRTG